MTAEPKAAIFDMDGTLLDSERVYLASFRAAEREVRAGVDDDLYMSLVGLGDTLANAKLRSIIGDRTDAFVEFMRHDLAERFSQPIDLKPTAEALLRTLEGVPLAVATSTRLEPATQRLALAGVGDYFDVVIGGDMIERGKPAPDIYLRASEGLGVSPTQCVAFEDSETGTAAGLAAGMVTVQVPDLSPAQNPDAGQIVADTLLAGARAAGLIP